MKVCPKCGGAVKPMAIVGKMICDSCYYSGPSEDFLSASPEVESAGLFSDAVKKLYLFLAQVISPQIGRKLIELELVGDDVTAVTKLLMAATRGSFAAIMMELRNGVHPKA